MTAGTDRYSAPENRCKLVGQSNGDALPLRLCRPGLVLGESMKAETKRVALAAGWARTLPYMTFPPPHRTQLHSSNPIEQLKGEFKRRTGVGIFPTSRPSRAAPQDGFHSPSASIRSLREPGVRRPEASGPRPRGFENKFLSAPQGSTA